MGPTVPLFGWLRLTALHLVQVVLRLGLGPCRLGSVTPWLGLLVELGLGQRYQHQCQQLQQCLQRFRCPHQA